MRWRQVLVSFGSMAAADEEGLAAVALEAAKLAGPPPPPLWGYIPV